MVVDIYYRFMGFNALYLRLRFCSLSEFLQGRIKVMMAFAVWLGALSSCE